MFQQIFFFLEILQCSFSFQFVVILFYCILNSESFHEGLFWFYSPVLKRPDKFLFFNFYACTQVLWGGWHHKLPWASRQANWICWFICCLPAVEACPDQQNLDTGLVTICLLPHVLLLFWIKTSRFGSAIGHCDTLHCHRKTPQVSGFSSKENKTSARCVHKAEPGFNPSYGDPQSASPPVESWWLFFPCCGLIKHWVCFSEALGRWHLASHTAQLGAGFPSRGPAQAAEGPHPWVLAPRESGATEGPGCSPLSIGAQEASYQTNT